MIDEVFQPHPRLADYVQLIWVWETDDLSPEPYRSRIVPDGIVELVIHYGNPLRTHYPSGNVERQPQGFAISQMRHFIELEPCGNVGLISVRFFPWGAYHFFGRQVKDFLDRAIPLDLIWKDDEIVERIALASSTGERVNILQQFLVEKLHRHYRNDTVVDELIRHVRRTKGQLSVEQLAAQTGYTQRQLARKFNASVGASPKLFSRITRFLNICHQLEEHSYKTLTEITYECGYYDQAHFNREFIEFAGMTPRHYFKLQQQVSFANI